MPEPAPTALPAKHANTVAAAARCFAVAGYQRTQMADIAAAADVALGTLYRVSASKADLFAMALAFGAGRDPAEAPAGVTDVEAFFEARAAAWFGLSAAHKALAAAKGPPAPFPVVAAAMYDAIAARALALRILDRSAHDLPRLGGAYAKKVRAPALAAMTAYLERLVAAKQLAPLQAPAVSARFVLETCAWFAMHRPFSPGGAAIDDAAARAVALHHLALAFPEPGAPR